MSTIPTFKPTTEQVIAEATKKQHVLFENNQMIRLYGSEVEHSYWVMKSNNRIWVGYLTSEGTLPNLFSGRKVYELVNANGNVQAVVQILTK